MFFLDLDRFKLINDSLSHDAGDELLKAVAKRILTLLREEDTLSRLGGDEFVVLAPSIYKHENLLQIASRLQSAFEQPFEIVGRLLSIHSSIGIAVYPEDGDTAEKLLRNADLAMYASKESGNGQCKFYIKKLNEDALQKLEIENELRLALAQQEFMLYYQPQYNTFTNEITTIEALIRWKHPIKGILESIEFIRDAEESRLIIPIGEWVLKTACLQNKLWQDNGLIHTRIAVNISPQQMKSVFFVDSVKNILKETKLKPEFLELEITENVILSGTKVLQILAQLRELNINITLDDFGSGNSSFSYLRSASIDRIKIDPSFIKNIDINSKDEIMIQSILNITKSMEIDVVAEGVETQDQMTFLKNMSCNEVQGYYYSQPIRAEQLTAILKDQSRQKARK